MAGSIGRSEVGGEVRPIRVLIANGPRVMSEIVADLIAREPDMVVVGQVEERLDRLIASSGDVDVLVLNAPNVETGPQLGIQIRNGNPSLKVLVVSTRGEDATMYWLGLRHEKVTRVSGAALVQAIRRAHVRTSRT